jgi:hypothetical protein
MQSLQSKNQRGREKKNDRIRKERIKKPFNIFISYLGGTRCRTQALKSSRGAAEPSENDLP